MTTRRDHEHQLNDGRDTGVVDYDHDQPGHEPGASTMISMAPIEPLAVDVDQAATLIGVSRSAFYKLASAGLIGPAGVRLGKHVRYPLVELREWAAAGMPPRHEWAALHGRLGGSK